MTILSETLSVVVQNTIQLNNVYDHYPNYKNLPYATLRNIKNKYWETLLSNGIEARFMCEIYTSEINTRNISLMINNLKTAFTNKQILVEHPNILDIQIDSYKINTNRSILSGVIELKIRQTGLI